MRVGAEHGDTITSTCKDIRSRGAARNVARTRDGQSAVGALRTAQTELRHGTPLCRLHHTRRLGGNECLEPHDIEKRRLEQLALERGTADADHRLAREHEIALGNGIDIHMRVKVRQIVQKALLEQGAATGCLQASQIVDVLGREAQVLDELGQLHGAAHDRIRAPKRMVAIERGKAALLVELAALPHALSHGELVEVGEHSDIGGLRGVGESHGSIPSIVVDG